jgi:hypothetical protein
MQHPSLEDIEALNSMTLQVGLLGSDGIVLASDRLVSQWEGAGFSQIRTSKMLQGDGVLCCYSGDLVSEHAANNIRSLRFAGGKEHVRDALKDAANRAWQDIGIPGELHEWQPTRKVIVALWRPALALWVVHVSPRSTANEVLDKVIAGDDKNTARHFFNNYVPYPPAPVDDLIGLAAHIVLTGGKENPSGVKWLEVAIVPKDGSPVFLSEEQEVDLERLSDDLDLTIKHKLSRPFCWRE